MDSSNNIINSYIDHTLDNITTELKTIVTQYKVHLTEDEEEIYKALYSMLDELITVDFYNAICATFEIDKPQAQVVPPEKVSNKLKCRCSKKPEPKPPESKPPEPNIIATCQCSSRGALFEVPDGFVPCLCNMKAVKEGPLGFPSCTCPNAEVVEVELPEDFRVCQCGTPDKDKKEEDAECPEGAKKKKKCCCGMGMVETINQCAQTQKACFCNPIIKFKSFPE